MSIYGPSSFRTLYTSPWYEGMWKYNWLGQILDDLNPAAQLAKVQTRFRTREETGLQCTVIYRIGKTKQTIPVKKFKWLYYDFQNRYKWRYLYSKWITPWWTYAIWNTYKHSDFRWVDNWVYKNY